MYLFTSKDNILEEYLYWLGFVFAVCIKNLYSRVGVNMKMGEGNDNIVGDADNPNQYITLMQTGVSI